MLNNLQENNFLILSKNIVMSNIFHANVRSIQVREQKTCTDNSSGILRAEYNKCVYASRLKTYFKRF